ncbi:MAG TPA: hypothetical protein VGK29_06070 [Paludibaculum sp.]|jgi:hypothetical protein
MRTFISLFLLVSCAAAQSIPPNRLTFSGGWSRESGGSYFDHRTATGLGLSYAYRFHPHVEAEAGLIVALSPSANNCGQRGGVDCDDRLYWAPFGVRFVAPIRTGRLELSAGGGGLYERYTVGNPIAPGYEAPRHGWGGYFVGSTAIALDRSHHFWLGVTPRWFLANPPYNRDRWFQLSGEFSIRF